MPNMVAEAVQPASINPRAARFGVDPRLGDVDQDPRQVEHRRHHAI
jgi:hypothetical protein